MLTLRGVITEVELNEKGEIVDQRGVIPDRTGQIVDAMLLDVPYWLAPGRLSELRFRMAARLISERSDGDV
jgi:hypothetical protein